MYHSLRWTTLRTVARASGLLVWFGVTPAFSAAAPENGVVFVRRIGVRPVKSLRYNEMGGLLTGGVEFLAIDQNLR